MAGNEAWSLTLNLAGRKDFTPGESFDRVPTGPYMVLIKKTEQVPKADGNGCDNVLFHMEVNEGQEKGKKLRLYLPVDPNVHELIADKWATLARSCIKNPAALESGSATHNAKTYNGKVISIYVQDDPGTSKDKNGKERPNLQNISPISKATYDKFRAEMGASATGTANGAAGAAMTVTGGPATANSGAAPTAPAAVALD